MTGEKINVDVFWDLPELTSFFPLRFSGKAVWNEFTGQCAGCKEDILDTHLRGHVRRLDGHTFTVEASGYCPSCHLVTRFMYRLHDDMSITGKSPLTGQIARWASGTGEQDLQ